MATSHDHDQDISAGLVSAAGDLEVPEAVAEETVGGSGNIIRLIPGSLKWQSIQLKIGITTDRSTA